MSCPPAASYLDGPPLNLVQLVHVSLGLGSPGLSLVFHVQPLQYHVEGNKHISQPAGCAGAKAAQHEVHLCCCKGSLLTLVQFVVHQGLTPSIPNLCYSTGLPHLGGRTLRLPLDFMRLLSAHFSCSWSLMWVATVSFSALMPQPNLGLGTSLLPVLINQDKDGHQSGHIKWYQT